VHLSYLIYAATPVRLCTFVPSNCKVLARISGAAAGAGPPAKVPSLDPIGRGAAGRGFRLRAGVPVWAAFWPVSQQTEGRCMGRECIQGPEVTSPSLVRGRPTHVVSPRAMTDGLSPLPGWGGGRHEGLLIAGRFTTVNSFAQCQFLWAMNSSIAKLDPPLPAVHWCKASYAMYQLVGLSRIQVRIPFRTQILPKWCCPCRHSSSGIPSQLGPRSSTGHENAACSPANL
jgi:hypothetical protein